MKKLVLLFRRRQDLGPDEFTAHWRDVHVPLVLQVPGVRRYVISPGSKPLSKGAQFDGMAELWFDDEASMELALASAESAATGIDGRNFIEHGSIVRFACDEETMRAGVYDRG